jgi:hypothetical protein
MNDMGSLMDQVQAELYKQFKATTEDQRAEEERQRQIQRDWEAKHTATETEEDRNDKYEYPDDDSE